MSRRRPARHIDPTTGKLAVAPTPTESMAIAPPGPRLSVAPPGAKLQVAFHAGGVALLVPTPDGGLLSFPMGTDSASRLGVGLISAAAVCEHQKKEAEAEAQALAAELDAAGAGANDDLLAGAQANVAALAAARADASVPLGERYRKAKELYDNYGVAIDPALQAEWDAAHASLAPDAGPDHPAIRPGREDAA